LTGTRPLSLTSSFRVAGQPKYVVIVMVPQSGEGADVSAPAARQIWDGIYGLEGHKGAYPNGTRPSALPVFQGNGTISPPPGYQSGP
jgi:penicillin-binding protein 2